MPAENLYVNRMSVTGTSFSMYKGKVNGFHAIDDQLYKLIEYDEGVPFRLIFGHHPGEGCYHYIGDGIRKLLGIDTGSISEKMFREMIGEIIPLSENIPIDPDRLRMKLANGEISNYKIEMLVTSRTGDKKWLREASIPLKDEKSGKIIGILGILHDVTERRRVQAYLAEESQKADECDRLKSVFLQNISHEVRTPLNAIIGFSALLREPEQGYGIKKEFIEMINNSTHHFLEIMDNIMEISRIEAGAASVIMTEVDPANVLKSIHGNFRQRADEKKLALICSVPENNDETRFITDGYKLRQVINNLVGNALKFTISGKVEFGYELKKGNIIFYVTDTGIGIGDEHRSKIFNKFFQAESGTTRRFQGTGLGLSISKAYIDMLGGSLDFSSEPDEGSTFKVTLPYESNFPSKNFV